LPTIREIAKELGVSTSTVSAVINNRGYVSAPLRARIEEAIRKANYRPDQIARSLRLRETRTIALIVPDLTNSFYSRLMRGTEDYLAEAEYRLLVVDSRESWNRQNDYLLSFSGKIADGIILVPCMATSEQIDMIPSMVRDTPLVYVDRSPLHSSVDSILIDNERAAYEATSHLLDLGHQRIAIITEPLNLLNAADRLEGYRRALRSRGIPASRELISIGNNTEDSGYWRGLELLKLEDRPTAILACNNLMTLGALAALRELNITCPNDVSLIGFDDFDWSSFLQPPLTMVRQPAAELGAAAAKCLLKRVRRLDQSAVEKVLLPTQLIIRGSTAAPGGGNHERNTRRQKD
jgi:LacI family transcriptional regulator